MSALSVNVVDVSILSVISALSTIDVLAQYVRCLICGFDHFIKFLSDSVRNIYHFAVYTSMYNLYYC